MSQPRSNLQLVTGPAELPLSLHELKNHLKVDDSDNEDDALIMEYQRGAVELLDGRDGVLGRALLQQTWDLNLDCFPPATLQNTRGAIRVPLPPLVSVTSVTYVDTAGDSQTWSSTLYDVSNGGWRPSRIAPAYAQEYPSVRDQMDPVTVRFVAGWTRQTLPSSVRSLIRLLVGHQYRMREPIVVGTNVGTVPFAVDQLIRQWKITRF